MWVLPHTTALSLLGNWNPGMQTGPTVREFSVSLAGWRREPINTHSNEDVMAVCSWGQVGGTDIKD